MSEILTPAAEITEVEAPKSISIPLFKEEEFDKRVATANRRLERAGAEQRFVFTREEFEVKKIVGATELIDPLTGVVVERFGGTEVTVLWVAKTLVGDSFELAVGDHTFVASLVAEEAGYTVHTAPGQSLEGWVRPAVDDIHCDHCHTVRNRVNIYIVRNNADGSLLQLGSNCIAPHLGFSPSGLWALSFTEELRGLGSDEGSSYSQRDYAIEVDRVLATAFAYSDRGRAYVSTARAYDGGPVATVGKVRQHIFGGYPDRRNFGRDEAGYRKAVEEFLAKEAEIKGFLADTALLDAIKASVETVKAESDYGQNLRVILAGESGVVRDRNVGILASLVSVYARENELAVERAAKPAPTAGFLAPVKDAKGKASRLRGLELTLTRVRYFDGDYGTTTLLVGTGPEGHAVEWFASGHIDAEAGDVLTLDASVKAHKPAGSDQYTKADTTVLTRGKILA